MNLRYEYKITYIFNKINLYNTCDKTQIFNLKNKVKIYPSRRTSDLQLIG